MCSLPVAYEDDELKAPPSKVKVPRRRWMSVTDLVTEVEQALVKGERLEKGGDPYKNLQREATRLRMDNDALIVEADELKAERDAYVDQEEQIHKQISAKPGEVGHLAGMVEVTETIKEVDIKLAGLRYQQQQNIRDVGSLKRTMSRIEKRAEVTTLVDRVEASLARSSHEEQEGIGDYEPEAKELLELAGRLRDEFEKATPKALAYERDIAELGSKLRNEELTHKQPTPETDDARRNLISKLQQAKRMIAQLSRLIDIQTTNAQEIGMLERVRAKLIRHVEISHLLKAGDAGKLAAKAELLQEEIARVRSQIKTIESDMEADIDEANAIIAQLREKKDSLTPETGKLREQLIATIHRKEQVKGRLAALRGEKVQNLRALAVLQAALAAK